MKIKQALRYGIVNCILAYLLGVVLIAIILAVVYKGTFGLVFNNGTMLEILTLMLSGFSWWGGLNYLSVLVPLLASCIVLTLLVYGYGSTAGRRVLFTGLSVFIYYLAMCLVFLVHGLLYGWGDIAYGLLWLWPVAGFVIGCAAGAVVEKVSKPQLVD